MSHYDVYLTIQDTETGIGANVLVHLQVYRAENGRYIASDPQSPLIAAGTSPRGAIMEYLSTLLDKSTEAQEVTA